MRLSLGPIHAVPSVHWEPCFAAQVLRRASDVRPDAVAVELIPELLDPYVEAVRRFPRLSGVITDDGEFCPVVPTDSIAQAVRWALQHDVPIHAVDMPRKRRIERTRDTVPPPAIGERLGLAEYYRIAAPLVEQAKDGSPDDLRERMMASRLNALAKHHKAILFVCGLAHWEAIRQHLTDPTRTPRRIPRGPYRVVHLTARGTSSPATATGWTKTVPPTACASTPSKAP